MEEAWCGSMTCEKGLGVLVKYKLNLIQQCDMAAKKTKAIIKYINSNRRVQVIRSNCSNLQSRLWSNAFNPG